MSRTYTIAGYSTYNGVRKLRLASNDNREKVLASQGHTNIDLYRLPKAMSKDEAIEWLARKGVADMVATPEAATVEPEVPETDEEIIERVSTRFEILNEMTLGAISEHIRAMIVTGPPGIGKSHGVIEMLEKHAMMDHIASRNEYYRIVKGAVSPIGLYKILFDYSQPGNVITFDDCDIWSDELSLNLLKGALDTGKKRIISWNLESKVLEREGIPNHFDFQGSVIFITNLDIGDTRSKKMLAHLNALKSRCHYLDLSLNTVREKVLYVQHVARSVDLFKEYAFDNKTKEAILDFMVSNKDTLQEISLRMAVKIADLAKMSPKRWKEIASVTCAKS